MPPGYQTLGQYHAEHLIEVLIAPLFLRLLVTGGPIDGAFADRLVDGTLRDLSAQLE